MQAMLGVVGITDVYPDCRLENYQKGELIFFVDGYCGLINDVQFFAEAQFSIGDAG